MVGKEASLASALGLRLSTFMEPVASVLLDNFSATVT